MPDKECKVACAFDLDAEEPESKSSKLSDDLDKDLTKLDGQAPVAREEWGKKIEFLLAIIGFAVGLGNVWRFPYLCQKHGGGAFLFPYTLMLFLLGIPIFYMEMAIGQRLRKGSIGVWDHISPYLGGLGWASVCISYLVGLYYNVIIAWCLLYFFRSFTSTLPWEVCPTYERFELNTSIVTTVEECDKSDATSYFWYRVTLEMTESIEDSGGLKWPLVLALLGAWIIIYLCMMKGIASQGKVVYFTATFPYLVLFIFFVRGVMLPGAGAGLAHVFTPRWERLKDPQLWLDAATQIFYSFGLAFGSLIAYSSYNPVKNNCRRDAIVVSIVNWATSLFAAIVVFSILGFKGYTLHHKCIDRQITSLAQLHPQLQNLTYDEYMRLNISVLSNYTIDPAQCDFKKFLDAAAEGTGLAFIIFTEAIVEFPGAPFWSLMFFLMLLTLGVGSQFGLMESVATCFCDLALFKWMKRKELTAAVICGSSFLIGLIFCTGSGQYWVQIFDSYAGSYPLMIVALLEVIGVMYIYGWRKFYLDIEFITGEQPGVYWQLMWRFVSPIIMGAVLVASIVFKFMSPFTYHVYSIETATLHPESYPAWAVMIIAFIIVFAIGSLPLVAILRRTGVMKYSPVAMTIASIDTTLSTARMIRSDDSFQAVDTQIEMLEDGVVYK